MGWLDKTLKNIVKSPLGKAAIMGGLAMTPWGKGIMGLMGKHGGTKGMGMLANLWAKPLISKPLTNAAMSYGLAKLMRSKNPEQAALWSAGMTLPFLGMQAQAAAKTGVKGTNMWDILLGKGGTQPMPGLSPLETTLKRGDISPAMALERSKLATKGGFRGPDSYNMFKSALEKGWAKDPGSVTDLSYWMKPELTKGTSAYEIAMAKAKNEGLKGLIPDLPFKFWNTATPLLGGVYAARETRDQAWKRIQEERKKQMAWMYGVDPEDITGEMTNPWYDVSPPSLDWKYANQGGIMDLDAGGDVSGPGTGTSDSINAKLSDGEFVMTAKAVENFGGGSRQAGANKMYKLMNQLDPQSETPQEGMA